MTCCSSACGHSGNMQAAGSAVSKPPHLVRYGPDSPSKLSCQHQSSDGAAKAHMLSAKSSAHDRLYHQSIRMKGKVSGL